MKPPYKALTLAIHPSPHGFGWVAMESPFAPYDWGVVTVRGRDKNIRCLQRIDRLLERLTPETLVLEAFEPKTSARHTRITMLGRAIEASTSAKGVDVAVYPHTDVQRCFASVGAMSRQEIAEAVARQLPAFERMVPRKQRAWEPEARTMSLFSAAALALTNYQADACHLLHSLSSGGG